MERRSIKWTHTNACMFVRYDKKLYLGQGVCVHTGSSQARGWRACACVRAAARDVSEPLLLSGLPGMPGLQESCHKRFRSQLRPDERLARMRAEAGGNRASEQKGATRGTRWNNYPTSCSGSGHYGTSALFCPRLGRVSGVKWGCVVPGVTDNSPRAHT